MKISQSELETLVVSTARKLYTGNNPADIKIKADPEKATIHRGDLLDIYEPETKAYIAKYNIRIAESIKQALEYRFAGCVTFTARETDTLARKDFDLTNSLFRTSMLHQGYMFVVIEGSLEYRDNVFSLREFYNRGIRWRKELRARASDVARSAGDKALIDTANRLAEFGVPMWDGELERGFPVELTKPEYMDWTQYNKACRYCLPNPKPEEEKVEKNEPSQSNAG